MMKTEAHYWRSTQASTLALRSLELEYMMPDLMVAGWHIAETGALLLHVRTGDA